MALKLYHATSEYAADRIEQEGFRCGTHGFAGGAIYFSQNPDGACRKYRNGRGNPDILIECVVRLGRMLEAAKNTVRGEDVRHRGFDSVKISGLDVYAVFEAWRVNIVTFRRIGGFAFPSMRALRFEEQRQREERQRVQQLQQIQQRQQPPSPEPGWLPLAILGGVVLVAMAALTGVVR
ncbi:unnamed protein product [Cladocopium goreaui]|uniref:PARP catalytic domain-containing protein n=1 Tax=Cladocopium goreaui TaxID=2562237 RepID=A0A9P1DPB6_9DINO|nr:unnamed protein product [Cladocopium goreaui]